MQKEKNIFSSSVNGEPNIRVGKDFLMKLPFHSENLEEEEYLFLLYNKAPPPSWACRRRKIIFHHLSKNYMLWFSVLIIVIPGLRLGCSIYQFNGLKKKIINSSLPNNNDSRIYNGVFNFSGMKKKKINSSLLNNNKNRACAQMLTSLTNRLAGRIRQA